MSQNNHQQGFTIIELSLAMAFISVLLVIIATTIIFMSDTFTKGMTIRDLNQVGRSVVDDIRRTVADSSAIPADQIKTSGESGFFCTGKFSYVWNLGTAIPTGEAPKASAYKYTDGGAIRFARFRDVDGQICRDLRSDKSDGEKYARLIRSNGLELLSQGDRDLVLGEFTIQEVASDSALGQGLYTIYMVVRTNDDTLFVEGLKQCKTPAQAAGDENITSSLEYCAINEFSFIARAGSKT